MTFYLMVWPKSTTATTTTAAAIFMLVHVVLHLQKFSDGYFLPAATRVCLFSVVIFVDCLGKQIPTFHYCESFECGFVSPGPPAF